jgi:hypothetical protein
VPSKDGDPTEEFIDWCKEMCVLYDDCLAFEVLDGGTDDLETGSATLGGPRSVCHLKNAISNLGEDPSRDCWHNICRQSEENILSQLTGLEKADAR